MSNLRIEQRGHRALVLDTEGRSRFEIILGDKDDSVTVRSLCRGTLCVHPVSSNSVSLTVTAQRKGAE
ncbi:MAG: hypothetical protein RJQ08_04980 [Salinisphaeraceae bacterium]